MLGLAAVLQFSSMEGGCAFGAQSKRPGLLFKSEEDGKGKVLGIAESIRPEVRSAIGRIFFFFFFLIPSNGI